MNGDATQGTAGQNVPPRPPRYDGGAGLSCDDGCAAVGLVCSEEQLYANDGDVDSDVEALALIATVGGLGPASCSDNYGTGSGVPAWVEGTSCFYSTSGRALDTFDCATAPPQPAEHRLCYCHEPATTAPYERTDGGGRMTGVAAGYYHACATNATHVWCWGCVAPRAAFLSLLRLSRVPSV